MPPKAALQRGRMAVIVKLIAVSLAHSAEARVKIRRDGPRVHHADVAGKPGIERKGEFFRRNPGKGIKMRDLPERVHPGVRPAGAGYCRGSVGQILERLLQHLLHCDGVDLALPTRIGRAVVRHRQCNPS